MDAWASERALYDFGDTITLGNYIDVGHYTQVVWSSTTHVGCGMAVNGACEGSPRQLWVCRYTPPGNFLGQAPYGFVADPCVDLDNDDVFQHEDPDDTDRTVP